MQDNKHSKQFYFINKSEKSAHISKSLSHEKQAVQRYVQTGRKRSRRSKLSEVEIGASLRRVSIPPAAAQPGLNGQPSQASDEEADKPERGNAGKSKYVSSLQTVHRNFWQPASHSTAPPFWGSMLRKRDPFDATSVSLNQSVASLLHYYVHYYHPSQWQNEITALEQGAYIHQNTVWNMMNIAVADRLTMYCILSAAACRIQFVDKLPYQHVNGLESFYIHMALQLLSSHLKNVKLYDSEQIEKFLLYVMFLNSAEAYRGNISAAKVHLSAMKELLQPMGGLAMVKDECLKGQIAMADLGLSCFNLEPCLFDCCYDPGPASALDLQSSVQLITHAICPASSLLNRDEALVPSELETLIKEILESYIVKGQITSSSTAVECSGRTMHWITLRNMAIRNRLLAMKTTDPKVHSLRIALIMWTLLSMNVTGRAKTVKVMAPKLKVILSQMSPSDWTHNEDVKLWIVMVGFYCATSGSTESAWFIDECCRLCRFCITPYAVGVGVFNMAEKLEEFQRRFFFDAPVQRAQTQALAENLHYALH